MTFIVALLASLAAVALFPADAWAWGPITHIVHGSTVLESLHLLPPALASLLAANAERYLYGCVGADIIPAKAYTRSVATHCHRWPVAWNILGSARTDGEIAFAWGYMTHLAADIISHNHFVPLHLVLSFDGRTSGHAYWEARVDGLQGQLYADRLRRVLTQRYDDCDGLVDRVVEHTLFSFRNVHSRRSSVPLSSPPGPSRGRPAPGATRGLRHYFTSIIFRWNVFPPPVKR